MAMRPRCAARAALHRRGRGVERGPVRQQGRAVDQRPAVILDMGDLDPRGAEPRREGDHARHTAQILAMDDEIAGQRQARRHDGACGRDLLRLGAGHPADALGLGRIRVLEGKLDMVEPRVQEGRHPPVIEQDAGGDEIGVEPGRCRRPHQRGQIGARHRLPAREM